MKKPLAFFLIATVAKLSIIIGANISRAEEIKVPVVDGMTITLGNYLQNVQARAKSMGPGLCAVRFSFNGSFPKQTRLFAPPLVWSKWQDLKPTFVNGPITVTVNYDEECDTGAIAELKYHKQD